MWEQLNPIRSVYRATEDYAVRLSINYSKKEPLYLAVIFSGELTRLMQWRCGDRVEVLIDRESELIGFRRTENPNAGWKISHWSGASKAARRQNILRFSFRLPAKELRQIVASPKHRIFTLQDVAIDERNGIVSVCYATNGKG